MNAAVSEGPSPTHDDLIKSLLSHLRHLLDFFRAFLPEILEFADFSDAEYLDKEHARSGKRPRRAGDLLIKARWREQETAFLIHIESQHKARPSTLERVGEYALRDSIRYRLPVMPVLLLTFPKPAGPQPHSLRWTFGKLAAIHVRCPVLQFQRMDPCRHLQSANVAALALTSLMRLNPGQQVEAIVQTLAEALRQRFGQEEMEAAMAFVQHYTPLAEVQLLQLHRRVRTLSESEPLLAPMPALINPFVELGKLEGRQEGRTEGELMVVLRQLQRKFPRIHHQAAPLVEALPEDRLLAFGEALLFFASETECSGWLQCETAKLR